MAKKFLIVFFILACSICLSLNSAYAQDSLYVIYNTIYGTALTSNQELDDTYGLACSDTCEPCTQDGDCIAGTCDPIDDEVWIETNGYVVATARFAGYTQSFGYYTDICVGNDQTELFNVTTTGYLTECSPESQNPGDACVEDSDCPDGACVSPYNNIFFVGGGTEIFGFYDDPSGSPQWFSQTLLNVDGNNDHMVTYRAADFNPLAPEYLIAWEDLNLGDADYNDLVVVLQHQSPCISLECCVVDGDCDDFDNCTEDSCVDSVCQHNPVDCSSLDDQCNEGVCDSGTGSCIQDPTPKNGDPCDDGDACTTVDTCAGGSCVGGSAPDCDDGNLCTDDSCNPASGCVNTNNTAPCDDGDACTTTDTCAGGACVGGSAPDCDDGNVCTDDSCNPASGCVNTNNTASCDDGDACTTSDTCDSGACNGSQKDCSSLDDQCNEGICDPGTGNCFQDTVPKQGDPCNDGIPCTVNDTCDDGACSGSPADCSSLNDQCNVGACDPGTGNCFQDPVPRNGDPCDDGDPTTGNDTCSDGVCLGGSGTASAIPTLSEWGMIILMTVLLGIGVITILRRREEQKSSIR